MFYGVVFIRAALLAAGILWCYHIIKRLPDDISELRGSFRKFRKRNDPDILGTMKPEYHDRYREDCSTEFSGTVVVQVLFLWPVTAVVLFFLGRFVVFGILAPLSRFVFTISEVFG